MHSDPRSSVYGLNCRKHFTMASCMDIRHLILIISSARQPPFHHDQILKVSIFNEAAFNFLKRTVGYTSLHFEATTSTANTLLTSCLHYMFNRILLLIFFFHFDPRTCTVFQLNYTLKSVDIVSVIMFSRIVICFAVKPCTYFAISANGLNFFKIESSTTLKICLCYVRHDQKIVKIKVSQVLKI